MFNLLEGMHVFIDTNHEDRVIIIDVRQLPIMMGRGHSVKEAYAELQQIPDIESNDIRFVISMAQMRGWFEDRFALQEVMLELTEGDLNPDELTNRA